MGLEGRPSGSQLLRPEEVHAPGQAAAADMAAAAFQHLTQAALELVCARLERLGLGKQRACLVLRLLLRLQSHGARSASAKDVQQPPTAGGSTDWRGLPDRLPCAHGCAGTEACFTLGGATTATGVAATCPRASVWARWGTRGLLIRAGSHPYEPEPLGRGHLRMLLSLLVGLLQGGFDFLQRGSLRLHLLLHLHELRLRGNLLLREQVGLRGSRDGAGAYSTRSPTGALVVCGCMGSQGGRGGGSPPAPVTHKLACCTQPGLELVTGAIARLRMADARAAISLHYPAGREGLCGAARAPLLR